MTTLTHRIIRFITASALGLGLLWSAPSRGAPPNTIANSVAVCDPWNPQRCAQPDASGNMPITGSISDGADVTQGAKADSAYAGSGSASVITILKGIYNRLVDLISSVQAAIPAGTARIGYTSDDPCNNGTQKHNFSFSQTSSGTIIPGAVGKKNYICSLTAIASAGIALSLVEYSGACTGGTPNVLAGSSIAANGLSLAANGGWQAGNGGASAYSGFDNANTGYNVCLLQNGAGTAAGGGTYAQQ